MTARGAPPPWVSDALGRELPDRPRAPGLRAGLTWWEAGGPAVQVRVASFDSRTVHLVPITTEGRPDWPAVFTIQRGAAEARLSTAWRKDHPPKRAGWSSDRYNRAHRTRTSSRRG